jgi:hypothetical protein
MPVLATLSTLWLATLFAHSGSMKLVNYAESRSAVRGYRLLLVPLALATGALLSWVELVAAHRRRPAAAAVRPLFPDDATAADSRHEARCQKRERRGRTRDLRHDS